MAGDINLNDLLRRYRTHPFEDYVVETPHTGRLQLKVEQGQEVKGPSGKWGQKPGTLLFVLERERNPKKVYSRNTGIISEVRTDLNEAFVEAREPVLTVQHRLNKEEIIDRILKEVLSIYSAPQRARYFLVPEIAAQIEKNIEKGVSIKKGDEILIMSLMKRDTILEYDGEPGVIYKVYFQSGQTVEQGQSLLGVCPPAKLQYVQKVVQRIRTEWDE